MLLKKLIPSKSLTTLLLCILSGNVFAGENIAIGGKGVETCAQFIGSTQGIPIGRYAEKDFNNISFVDEHEAYMQWARGFIVGNNWSNPSRQITRDQNETLDLWLRNFCNANPTLEFWMATAKYVIETRPPKQ